MNIAFLGDGGPISLGIQYILSGAKFQYSVFADGGDLIRRICDTNYQLLFICSGLSEFSHLDVIRAVRSTRAGDLPILVISGAIREMDLIACLNAGADAYVEGPISGGSLLAHIAALSRRPRIGIPYRQKAVAALGPYELYTSGRIAKISGKSISLTPKEFDLALLLFSNPGRVLSRTHIEFVVWGHELPPLSRALAGLVCRLRRVLEIGTQSDVMISGVHGVGYRLEARAELEPGRGVPY